MEISEVVANWAKKIPADGENKVSISELCRLCGNENSNFLPLYENDVDNNLRKKIEMHLPIRIHENDGLPQRVCYFCASTVLSFSDIYDSILNVEENFHKILKNASSTKQGVCVSGNKFMEYDLDHTENRKPQSSIKPAVRIVSVRDEVERSQQQDRESFSQDELDSRVENASFTMYSDASALLDALESGIIDNQPVVCSKSDATVSIDCFVDSSNQNGTQYVSSSPAQSSPTFNPGARFFGSQYLTSEDNATTTMISNEVLNMLSENSCDTADSRIEFDDVLLDSNNSKTVHENKSSAVFSGYANPRQQSLPIIPCRYKYRLKIIRNGRKMMYIIVQWQRIRNDGNLKCKYCKKSFHIATVLLTHSRFHTSQPPFYCKYCGDSFMLNGSLKYHSAHCIKTKKQLEIAAGLHHSEDSQPYYLCNSDDYNYSKNSSEGSNGKYTCELCGRNYKLRATLREHLMHHLGRGRRKLKCAKCSTKFLTKSELVEHVTTHDDYLVCELCHKVVLNEKDLQLHLVSHSNERPYSCKICGMSYKRKSHMTRHLLSHDTEKKKHENRLERFQVPARGLKCDECGEKSSTWSSHRAHMKTHKEQKYECDECGKLFAQPSGVTRHKHTVHNKARDFTCEQCKQCFSTKATLVNHLRIHTGERPHQCTICGKTFRTRQQQKMHESIHSDVFPFQCEYCGKSFRRKLHLIVHVRTHTGERPYVCPLCGRGFAQCNDRKKHMNVHR